MYHALFILILQVLVSRNVSNHIIVFHLSYLLFLKVILILRTHAIYERKRWVLVLLSFVALSGLCVAIVSLLYD